MQVRKKAMQQQAQQNLQDVKTHCTSEPRLNETETPQTHRRYGSTRRATHNSGESVECFLLRRRLFYTIPPQKEFRVTVGPVT